MMFASDEQRKAVMSKFNKPVDEIDKIKINSIKPSFPMNFSKGRGSVPLLPETYVIRGGSTHARKKIKDILDMIGDDPAMEKINTIRLDKETEIPIAIENEKTMILSQKISDDSVFNLGVLMLATAYRERHPEAQEGSEFSYAKELVEPKIREEIRKQKAEKEVKEAEVFQVGVEEQPKVDIDIAEQDGMIPLDVKITQVEPTKEEVTQQDESLPLGVTFSNDEDYVKQMEEKMKNNIYASGGVLEGF